MLIREERRWLFTKYEGLSLGVTTFIGGSRYRQEVNKECSERDVHRGNIMMLKDVKIRK